MIDLNAINPKPKKHEGWKIYKALWRLNYRTQSYLGIVFRFFFYKHVYFFDTNFIISKEEKLDKRYGKLFLWSRNFYVTETINSEINEKLNTKNTSFRKVKDSKFEVLSFDDLQNKRSICPTYYNFMGAMYNPADIASPDFLLQLIFSKILRGKKLTEEETEIHIDMMTRLINNAESETDPLGKKKDELLQIMDEAHIRSIKKRKDGLKGKNVNHTNDIRNLALIFTYALMYEKNVTFITADSDAIAYFFDWFSTLVQQSIFNAQCLVELDKNDKEGMKKVLAHNGEPLFFDGTEMIKFLQGSFGKYINNHMKYFSPRLTIKYWDIKRQNYIKVDVNVDKVMRQVFLSSHGSLNCPTAKNDTMGSFIAYRYWWPPLEGQTLKILPRVKPIYRVSQSIPAYIHDDICRYRRMDLSNNFVGFSSFTDEI